MECETFPSGNSEDSKASTLLKLQLEITFDLRPGRLATTSQQVVFVCIVLSGYRVWSVSFLLLSLFLWDEK